MKLLYIFRGNTCVEVELDSSYPQELIAVPKQVRCNRLLTGKGFRSESVPRSTENRYKSPSPTSALTFNL